MPAHVPKTGPELGERRVEGDSRISRMKVVDSPPGSRDRRGLRAARLANFGHVDAEPRSICTCSRKFPCTARTPIRSGFTA